MRAAILGYPPRVVSTPKRSPSKGCRPKGFTLVELLVVITIIGMLMAMLFPALGSIMERLNRMSCANKMKDIANTVRGYEGAKSCFPGYNSRMPGAGGGGGGGFKDISWIAALQEHSNREVYEAIRRNTGTVPRELTAYGCPSDPVAVTEGRTSYVGNCGRQDQTGSAGQFPPDWAANGVFHRHVRKGASSRDVKFRSADIVDGADKTLLISENLQAGPWMSFNEHDIGFVWFTDTKSPDFPQPESKMMNKDKTSQVCDINHARPSSNHVEGANVAYCDGQTTFLSDRIKYAQVYCKLMTPDGFKAADPGSKTPVQLKPYREPLDESLIQ